MVQEERVEVAKGDLRAAWAVLENLAVSLDQIGSKFAEQGSSLNGAESLRRMQEALDAYLTPELVMAINDARVRLGRYIPDEEAEAIAEQIRYWDYAAAGKVPGETR
jgi:hypothetical protein